MLYAKRINRLFESLIIVLCLWCCSIPAEASISIAAVGGWSQIVTAMDLQGAGGSDLNPIYTSNVSQTVIAVVGTQSNISNWRVDVRRSAGIWVDDLKISIKRSSEGFGGGNIFGGTSYQVIGTTDSVMFSGSGDRSDIHIQLQLSGVSTATIFAAAYSTMITYTVVEI